MIVRGKRVRRSNTAGPVAQARILDAAEDLFYLEGARNVGIDAVVKRAGVNKMSLYRQFESKEDLLRQYLVRREAKFWAYVDAGIAKHPGEPRAQLRQLFVDLALRTSAPSYRGCPFVNIAVEFPDRSHLARRMVADNKARLLKRLTELVKAAGVRKAPYLAKALALLIEGAYAASQTYGPGSSLMAALPKAADALLDAAVGATPGTRPRVPSPRSRA
ncbi:MAG: transcriptional regulator, TetR family [Gammaproteobacteria bacterium]|nr:transcriptional regulator, TetR family [Gammaproteobacteria bacterium]